MVGLVTYTAENVSGLDVSSPVRYRGVPVGRVTNIRVDARGSKGPHGIIVEIDFELFLDRLTNIGIDVKRVRTITDIGGVFPRLRAQLMSNPVTGEAYLLLDVPETPPPVMDLGFRPSRPYVPSMPSKLERFQEQLPALVDRAEATLATLSEIVTRIPDSLDRSDRFFTNIERIMRESQLPELSADSRKFFTTTSAQIGQMTSELDGFVGKDGTLVKFSEETRAAIKEADFPAASQSTREAAESSRLAAEDLRRSLPVIRESLEELSELARQLEEQPESIVYGQRPERVKHK